MGETGRTDALGATDAAIAAAVASAVVHVGLVDDHLSEPALAAAFAAAAGAGAAIAALLALRPGRPARLAAIALFASLLVAYPAVHLLTGEHVESLDLATKAVEACGLLAALALDEDREAPLAPLDVLAGVLLATLLLSALGHGHGLA